MVPCQNHENDASSVVEDSVGNENASGMVPYTRYASTGMEDVRVFVHRKMRTEEISHALTRECLSRSETM
eukprot:scaffold3276_cov168-Amphora_coffeaeformis.AAC.3